MVTWHHLSWVLIPLLFAGSGSLADPGATSAIRGRQDSAVGEVERHSLKESATGMSLNNSLTILAEPPPWLPC